PLILIGGWVLSQYENTPPQIENVLPAILLVVIGFALWLTVFPFHTWALMLPQDNHLYEAGFFLVLITTSGFLVFLDFLNSVPWMRNFIIFNSTLQLIGAIMILYAGLGAWFASNLNRLLGFSLMLDSGFALIAIALGTTQGVTYFLELLPGRVLGVFLLTHSLDSLRNPAEASSLISFERLKPIFWATLGFLVGYFSLGGLPLLASFPVRQEILFSLAQQSLPVVMGVLLGNIFFLLNGIRLIGYALPSHSENTHFTNGSTNISFLTLVSIAGVLALGWLPALLLSPALQAAQSFINLVR
ncbi:MAG: proton-conducting transporter membrane subunit, partial [Thermanaerothrix sp.]|nr:proton-conducting transporter membrane subunit [Thermanaerothrix sp.]